MDLLKEDLQMKSNSLFCVGSITNLQLLENVIFSYFITMYYLAPLKIEINRYLSLFVLFECRGDVLTTSQPQLAKLIFI